MVYEDTDLEMKKGRELYVCSGLYLGLQRSTVNAFFQDKGDRLNTYKRGGRIYVIDYMLIRQNNTK